MQLYLGADLGVAMSLEGDIVRKIKIHRWNTSYPSTLSCVHGVALLSLELNCLLPSWSLIVGYAWLQTSFSVRGC